MAAYLIANIHVHDPKGFGEYRARPFDDRNLGRARCRQHLHGAEAVAGFEDDVGKRTADVGCEAHA